MFGNVAEQLGRLAAYLGDRHEADGFISARRATRYRAQGTARAVSPGRRDRPNTAAAERRGPDGCTATGRSG